ncbi:alkaline phosphatase family protein, partial [Verrucomicrobiota bacterium]
LMALSPDGRSVKIYGTMAGATEGWGYPRGIERRIIEQVGGYVEALELEGCTQMRRRGEPDLVLELMRLQADWITRCAAHLHAEETWDAMFIQYHAPDGISHVYLRDLESEDAAVHAAADTILCETIRLLARMVTDVTAQCADAHTFVAVVSDHGNMPVRHVVNMDGILMREGWTRFLEDEPALDTRRSVAVFGQSGVWINLKGREKHGCVESGADYEKLRSAIIERMLAVRCEETGDSPFAVVARREDLHGMGMWGDRIEDVVCFTKPYYLAFNLSPTFDPKRVTMARDERDVVRLEDLIAVGLIWDLTAVHWNLPNAAVDYASNRPVFLLSGPGIAAGARGKRVNLVDVAPTLAHCLGIQPPRQAEGRIVWEAFAREGPGLP